MRQRIRVNDRAVDSIVDRAGAVAAPAVARFLEAQQKQLVQSRRLRSGITSEYGRDGNGWYARAGMKRVRRTAAFFWYFHEFQTGAGGPGRPFIRPALDNNRQMVARMFTRGGL
jgi:hypothetical protein